MKCNFETYFEKNTNMFLKNTNYCLSDQFYLRQQDQKDAIRIIFEKKQLLFFFVANSAETIEHLCQTSQ